MTDFDPAPHLIKLSGKDYLMVAHRLLWLRSKEPEAVIETELVQHQNNKAIFRARVTLPSGASSTGWGSETENDFGDYLEKAETKAVGRALGMLGFGTQFTNDFDEGERIVDSPQGRPHQQGPIPVRQVAVSPLNGNMGGQDSRPPQQGGGGGGGKTYPTPGQLTYARKFASEAGLNWDTQANDIIFLVLGKTGPLYRNDEYQQVTQYLIENKDAEWIYTAEGHLERVPF